MSGINTSAFTDPGYEQRHEPRHLREIQAKKGLIRTFGTVLNGFTA
jgi:hypothetical protein